MGYWKENWEFDWDGAEFDDRYVVNYITTRLISANCVPDWVTPRPTEEQLENLQQVEQRLAIAERIINDSTLSISKDKFIKDKELIERVNKFNLKQRTNNDEIELEPLYYLTLYLYGVVKESAFNGVIIDEERIEQLSEALIIASMKESEIAVRIGKAELVITDRKLIELIFNQKRILSTLEPEDYSMLYSSSINIDERRRLSFTDASSHLAGLFFEYFDEINLSKGIISYLLYLTEWISNKSILLNNDYINSLLSNYKKIKTIREKELNQNLYS